MPRVPLNINSVKYAFRRCKTEEECTKRYEHELNTFGDEYTEEEKGFLRALYERRVYEIKNPFLSLRGRRKSKKDGRFIRFGDNDE